MMMVSSRSHINTRCGERNRHVIITLWRFEACVWGGERKTLPRNADHFHNCERVFTSISESSGGAGSLTLFLPLSFPSDPLRAGTPSSLPGVGGLGGGWYSPNTQPPSSWSVWSSTLLHLGIYFSQFSKIAWLQQRIRSGPSTTYLCVTLGCDWVTWRGVLGADRLTELWWQPGWCCCWLNRGCCSDVSCNMANTDSDCSLSMPRTPAKVLA